MSSLQRRASKWRLFGGHAAMGLLLLFPICHAYAYSVLTHEAIVDSTWDRDIKPSLVKRFPAATAEDLVHAHAFAYGGCVIQDLGYYPFGSKLFSDLTHYVRSGDFVANLITESQTLDEYAFALGALSHYAADTNGHPIATNVVVPVLYPKLARKFGARITYADDPISHGKTEFAFDVLQAAQGRYAPQDYKNFIGFQVAKPLLDRAFAKTYNMELKEVFTSVDLAIGSYRRAIGSILPAMTKVAWQLKGDEIRKEFPGATRNKFVYNLSRSNYEKDWGTDYEKPGFGSKVLAFFFRLTPKVGLFRALSFKKLTPDTEKMYMASFNSTIERYRSLLALTKAGVVHLPNTNLDVGVLTAAGKYKLADSAYSRLLHHLESRYPELPLDLRHDILAFYGNLDAPIATKAHSEEWAALLKDLDRLRVLDSLPPQISVTPHGSGK